MRIALVFSTCAMLAACRDPNAGVPRATSSAPVVATRPSGPGDAQHLALAPSSTIGFTGAKVTASHHGSFRVFTGAIDFHPDRIEDSRLHVDVETGSVVVDPERLATHLRSADFFDVEHFPHAIFDSTSLRPGPNPGAYSVTGNLTLHGQTRAITFPATVTATSAEVTATAEFSINRRDFGIVYPGMPDNLIRDDVAMHIALHAPRR